MSQNWVFFLLLVIASLAVQGFYSMLEMACVSFNRVRLQYFVSQKKKRAEWLNALLQRPTYLFGVTLIGVNAALQFGSECARRFYISVDLSPDWAPLTQIFIVLIFGELVPMFAARRFSERVTMLGIPIIYFTSLLLRPIIWVLDILCRFINKLFGAEESQGLYLSREELQKAIEERSHRAGKEMIRSYDPVLSHIFTLKKKQVKDLMLPLSETKLISSDRKVDDLRHLLGLEVFPFIPVYHMVRRNIVAIAYPRDYLRLSSDVDILPYARSPWFITESRSILEVTKEFRSNNQSLAIVLNHQGHAIGVLTLDAVVDEIFGERDDWVSFGEYSPTKNHIMVDLSLSGNTPIQEVNQRFSIHFDGLEGESLEDFMARKLGHRPEINESIVIDHIELKVEASSMIAGKTILIRSFY